MLFFYRIFIGLFFYLCLPLLLLFVFLTGKHREGLSERFGSYPDRVKRGDRNRTYWLHASSVGEVQAVRAIMTELSVKDPDAEIIVTTMTAHGKRVAQTKLTGVMHCFLAPLDVPWITDRGVRSISPDIYICFETELWPVLINSLYKQKVRICMVNGRISDRSYGKYIKLQGMLKKTLRQFDKLAVITEADQQKYISLGASPDDISAFGNVKYDLALPHREEEIVQNFKLTLGCQGMQVFIAGSTHTGEERILLHFYTRYLLKNEMLFLLAPRHMERIAEIEKVLQQHRIGYHTLSDIIDRKKERTELLVLVDTMGDLANLYSVADFAFCGGSLVNRGGHNLMEAALWQKAVFYGPDIADFRDAADLLESVNAGFQVNNIDELEQLITHFTKHPADYASACGRAGKVARSLQGCSRRQVDYILNSI